LRSAAGIGSGHASAQERRDEISDSTAGLDVAGLDRRALRHRDGGTAGLARRRAGPAATVRDAALHDAASVGVGPELRAAFIRHARFGVAATEDDGDVDEGGSDGQKRFGGCGRRDGIRDAGFLRGFDRDRIAASTDVAIVADGFGDAAVHDVARLDDRRDVFDHRRDAIVR
jgi:hypothetical protein